jgi:hypothetical protein
VIDLQVDLCSTGHSDFCELVLSLVKERGDCVAAQGNPDHDAVLPGG